jgi:hypothetical protein
VSNENIKVANVIIPAADQDRAVQFYCETLRLEKRVDLPFGEGLRRIEVAPKGAETPIAIPPPGPGVAAGGTGINSALQDFCRCPQMHGGVRLAFANFVITVSRRLSSVFVACRSAPAGRGRRRHDRLRGDERGND